MKTYELMLIYSSDIKDDKREKKIETLSKRISKLGGEVLHVEPWGQRTLAFNIRKQSQGYYVLFYFTLEPGNVEVVEKELRFDEEVLRYMTVIFSGEIIEAGKPLKDVSDTTIEKSYIHEPEITTSITMDEEALEGERLLAEEIRTEKLAAKNIIEEAESSDSEPLIDEELES